MYITSDKVRFLGYLVNNLRVYKAQKFVCKLFLKHFINFKGISHLEKECKKFSNFRHIKLISGN